jgi:ribosome-binding protein aMBF1 (putative translation factor)
VVDFAEMMRTLMDERGLGVRALARRVPCDPGLVSKFARGVGKPSGQMRRLLDDALEAGGQLHKSPDSGQTSPRWPSAMMPGRGRG